MDIKNNKALYFLLGLSGVIGLFAGGVVFLLNVETIYSGQGITRDLLWLALGVGILFGGLFFFLIKKFMMFSLSVMVESDYRRGPFFWFLVSAGCLLAVWLIWFCMILMGIGSLIWPLLVVILGIPEFIWRDKTGTKRKGSSNVLLISCAGLLVIGLLTHPIKPLTFDSFRIPQPLVVQIDRAYYNLYRKGLSGFSCDETASLVDEFRKDWMKTHGKNDVLLKAVKDLKFHLTFTANGQLTVDATGYQKTQDTFFNQKLDEMIDQVKTKTARYYRMWLDYTIFTLIPPQAGIDIEKKNDGYELKGYWADLDNRMDLDSRYKITEVQEMTREGQIFVFHPVFIETPDGFLLESTQFQLRLSGKLSPVVAMNSHCQLVNGFQLLDRLSLKRNDSATPEGNFDIQFQFSNYQLTLVNKT